MKTKLTDFKSLTVSDVPWLIEHVHTLEKANASLQEQLSAKSGKSGPKGVSAHEHSKLKAELSATNTFLGKVIKERDDLKNSLKSLQEDYDKLAETVGEPSADEPIPFVPVDMPVEESFDEPPAVEVVEASDRVSEVVAALSDEEAEAAATLLDVVENVSDAAGFADANESEDVVVEPTDSNA